MVSSSDSPFDAEERAMSRLSTSADSRLAAISKVVRVRVLFSKKRFTTSFLRRAGTILMLGRSQTSSKAWAWSRRAVMSRGLRGSMPSRCRWGKT